MTAIPESVAELVDVLTAMPGAVAVVLGGSRAVQSDDLCERGQAVCNEKRLLEVAGLSSLNALFAEIPMDRERLLQWVDLVADRLGVRSET